MASRHEQYVQSQRDKAKQIRDTALNGGSRSSQTSARSVTSRADAFRANAARAAEEERSRSKTVLQDTLSSVTRPIVTAPAPVIAPMPAIKVPQPIQNRSQPFQNQAAAFEGKLPSSAALVPSTGGTVQPEAPNKFMEGVNNFNAFTDRLKSSATLGATELVDRLFTKIGPAESRNYNQERLDRAENAKGGVVADVIGSFLPGDAAWKAGGALVAPLVKKAPKAIQTLARGVAGGTLFQTGVEAGDAANGDQQSLAGRAKDIGLSAALGGAGDLAISGLGKGAKLLFNRFMKGRGAAAVESVVPEIATNVPNETVSPTRARIETKPGLNAVLEQMKPLVDEKMKLPYNNRNEMARWIQSQFEQSGDSISMKEIRRLGEKDMRDLAEEMHGNITVEEAARQVAKDIGYDFDKLLSAKSIPKDLVQRARKTQELREIYGVGSPVRSSLEVTRKPIGETITARPEADISLAVAPEPAQAVTSKEMGSILSGSASGITEAMYDGLWSKVQKGVTSEAGAPSTVLQVAKAIKDRGGMTSIDELKGIAQEVVSAKNRGATGTEFQRLMNNIVESYSPEPVAAKVIPIGDPILRPGQFDEQSGLGIVANQRVGPYESLSTDTRSQLVTRQQRDPLSLKGSNDRAYIAAVDDLHSFNQQDKLLEDLMGEPLKASERIHTLGLASRGADVISKRIITNGLVDSKGKVVGESLKSILAPLNSLMKKNKHIYVDFEDYLLNKHAVTRFERGEKVFQDKLEWTPDFGSQKVAEYDQMFPEFAEAADKFYAFNKQMVKSWLVDTGIITEDTAKAWAEANPFYVPNKRQFTQLEKGNGGFGRGKKGFGNQSNPVKGYQEGGSQRKIISPIEATIENVDAYVKAAKRNGVMQQYVKNIERKPEAFKDWAEIIEQPEKMSDIKKLVLDSDGLDNLLARFSDDFDAAMQKTRLDKDNIVRVMVDGEPTHVLIKDKQLLSAVTALGPESAGWMLNMVGKVTNNMKLLTTGSNPVFSLTRNLFRDIPQAYVASTTRDNPIGFATELFSAAMDIARKRGAYKQFLDIGGGHASSIAADRNLLAQSKRAALPQSGTRKALLKTKDAYENFLNAVEIAPRLAEFKRSLDLTGDLQAALSAAQDITVNFKRRGALSKEIDKVFPYFNAAAQGLDKTLRTYKDNPVKAVVKSFIALTLPTLALYAVNHDDPAYQKLSSRVKDAFLMIPKGDGTFIKIAKPQEQGTIFSDIPERMMRLFAEEDPAAFRDFADRLRTTFLPPGIQGAAKKGGLTDKMLGAAGDTIFGPIADIAANKTFSGSPIVPGNLEHLSPELQYDAKTTSVGKWIGEKTGSSPKKLDYLARQYTGFLGQFGQPLLSPGGDVGSALGQQVTADPVFSNDTSTEFYHYKDKLDQANLDKDLKDLPDWYSDGLRKKMAKISKNMSAIRADVRDVQSDKGMSNKQKREELRKLQQSINDMAEYGNSLASGQVPY